MHFLKSSQSGAGSFSLYSQSSKSSTKDDWFTAQTRILTFLSSPRWLWNFTRIVGWDLCSPHTSSGIHIYPERYLENACLLITIQKERDALYALILYDSDQNKNGVLQPYLFWSCPIPSFHSWKKIKNLRYINMTWIPV